MHEGRKDFKCSLCGALFGQKGNALKHARDYHIDAQRSFVVGADFHGPFLIKPKQKLHKLHAATKSKKSKQPEREESWSQEREESRSQAGPKAGAEKLRGIEDVWLPAVATDSVSSKPRRYWYNKKTRIVQWKPPACALGGKVHFRGVRQNGLGFEARICDSGKGQSLGHYCNPEEAALAWDVAARARDGPKAFQNFHDRTALPPPPPPPPEVPQQPNSPLREPNASNLPPPASILALLADIPAIKPVPKAPELPPLMELHTQAELPLTPPAKRGKRIHSPETGIDSEERDLLEMRATQFYPLLPPAAREGDKAVIIIGAGGTASGCVMHCDPINGLFCADL